jgi:hypothetical protein
MTKTLRWQAKPKDVTLEVLMVVVVKMTSLIFWVVTPFRLITRYSENGDTMFIQNVDTNLQVFMATPLRETSS